MRKDGPPPYDVDVSHIPDATPKKERLAKYGNMSEYRVFGKEYHVMPTARNYQERGIASWYGTMFHAQRTSSGERYNMLAMTAAHKTLPLPTYVQVTNLRNGKKVIVKVNDRGPFAPDRIIDLSYVAAKKLGMLGRGTAYVDVKALDPDEALKHPQWLAFQKNKTQKLYASHRSHGAMYLQVGAFSNRLNAEKLKQRLLLVVSSPIEITHQGQTQKNLYRVKIGPIHDVATAATIKKKLRSFGLTPKHLRV
ncbi:MAG: septal ring lytic transglycosylase RlpA family protein [Gammaproteobacteria bacterium]